MNNYEKILNTFKNIMHIILLLLYLWHENKTKLKNVSEQKIKRNNMNIYIQKQYQINNTGS